MSNRHDDIEGDGAGERFFGVATVEAGGEITLPAEAAGLEAGDEILFGSGPPGLFPKALMAFEREALRAFLSTMATRMAALATEHEAAPPDEKNQRRGA